VPRPRWIGTVLCQRVTARLDKPAVAPRQARYCVWLGQVNSRKFLWVSSPTARPACAIVAGQEPRHSHRMGGEVRLRLRSGPSLRDPESRRDERRACRGAVPPPSTRPLHAKGRGPHPRNLSLQTADASGIIPSPHAPHDASPPPSSRAPPPHDRRPMCGVAAEGGGLGVEGGAGRGAVASIGPRTPWWGAPGRAISPCKAPTHRASYLPGTPHRHPHRPEKPI